MAYLTKTMSQIKQLFMLYWQGYSKKSISRITGFSRNTVKDYLRKVEQLNLSSEQLLGLSNPELEGLLVSGSLLKRDAYQDFMHRAPLYVQQLKEHKHLTRLLLWEEEKQNGFTAYSYSQFCEHLKNYMATSELTMVIEHIAGDKLYIDFAGDKLMLTDPDSGKLTPCELLLLTLGYSNYTVLVAVASQRVEDLIGGVNRALAKLGVLPNAIVPDNLKSAITHANRYEPRINESFLMMANHYRITVLPARAAKPRDKAKVETAVNAVYRQVYGRIRNQRFGSLAELNTNLDELEGQFNDRLMQGYGVSRRLLFERDERPKMRPLGNAFMMVEQLSLTVQKNYHVQIRSLNQYYSVPHTLAGQKVKVLLSNELVAIYHQGRSVATHPVCSHRKYITVKEHMSSAHRHYLENNDVISLRQRASAIDPLVLEIIDRFLSRNDHPEQGFKSCQGILSLQRKYGNQALVWACKMAKQTNTFTYRYINRVASSPYSGPSAALEQGFLPLHSNIRGSKYYQ